MTTAAVAWADVAIGALAMLGLALLVAGLLAGTHYAERRVAQTAKKED